MGRRPGPLRPNMRTVIPALYVLTCAAAMFPAAALAQQSDARIVDLPGTNTPAEEDRPRSAFGRVMDVMIATLIEEQTQPATARTSRSHAKRALLPPVQRQRAPAAAAAAAATPRRIEVTLGEGFELPSQADVARQASSGG